MSVRWNACPRRLVVLVGLAILLAVPAWIIHQLWWYPRSCNDPVIRAEAPTPRAVWIGGMDGTFVECARRDSGTCSLHCRIFTYEGQVRDEGCAECSPAGRCAGVDLTQCDSYMGIDGDGIQLSNGARIIEGRDSTLVF